MEQPIGEDASTLIPIKRSLIFWEVSEVCRWLEALHFDPQTVWEARQKRTTGANLISMVNGDRLREVGIKGIKRTQVLWNLERRIKAGDEKARTALDPRVFLGVEESFANLQRSELETRHEPYSDNPDRTRALPKPLEEAGAQRGGGVASSSGGAGDLLDLMSLDMNEQSSKRDAAAGNGAKEFLAIEAAPEFSSHPPRGASSATEVSGHTGKPLGTRRKASTTGKQTFNLIDLGEGDGQAQEGDEEEHEGGEEGEESNSEKILFAEDGPGPEALVFEVVFPPGDTPNILLEESQPGNKLKVKSFPKRADGSRGNAERNGRIEKGDFLVAVNSIRLEGFAFNEAIQVLTTQGYPLALRFRRVPKHLQAHDLEGWSVNALRTVLLEEGAELTGLERHAQLVAMAKRAFWNKPVPLPPAAPHVAPGTAAMINGDTSVCGWLLMKGPHDLEFQRLFCDLHGNELLYHKPKGGVTEGAAGYHAAPAGFVDMSKVKLVATTRSSEEGHKDLRMVNEDNQVYLLSFAKEDALTQWMRKLNTAMIIAPGGRTSGAREPSAPYLVSKTHRSLTVMWLPPRQPYLNSVHSFQLAYKQGINPLKDWTMATDEAHGTRFTIKGLKEGERYFTKVRAMHELERGQMVWGEWSDTSQALLTDREAFRSRQPARHLWVLAHGLRGDADDMKYLATAISSRHGSDARVLVVRSNSAAFKTLDGISKGGTRLYEEVMQAIDSLTTAERISFIAHGLGGVYARYALRLLADAGVFERLDPVNFVTLGTPHLGTLKSAGGVVGRMVDNETAEELSLKDTDMKRGGSTRDAYGVGGANSMRRGSNYGIPGGGGAPDLGGTRPPLLARMTGEEYLAPLRLFRRRVLYANVKFDGNVEYPSASIRLDDPYVYVPDSDLFRMCSPHYSHVMLNSSQGNLGGMDAAIARGPGGGFPTALAEAAPEPGMWEVMAQVLDSLGWERVDIFNAEGMSPYKDLIVASEWLNAEGKDIVRHVVDTAPNKVEALRREGGGEEEGEDEAQVEVVEDLITGLDDEDAN